MIRPDRFERTARRQYSSTTWPLVAEVLRRQHAAYVRMVKAEMALAKGQCYAEQRGDALNELLAAFARYKKGKP